MLQQSAYINGCAYPIEDGETIYEFVSRHLGDVTIPVLCHDPVLEPFGSCRLCSVEVAPNRDTPRKVVAACHTPVQQEQHIWHGSGLRQLVLRCGIVQNHRQIPDDMDNSEQV